MTSATTGKVSSAQDAGNDTAGELVATKWLLGVFIDFCEQLAEVCDADLSESFVNINAVGQEGSRELAKVSIRELIERHRSPAAPPTEGQDCGMKQEGEG